MDVYCKLIFFQCFDSFGWTTGKPSSLHCSCFSRGVVLGPPSKPNLK